MGIAAIWFFVAYQAGYIFYYPPILFVIGAFRTCIVSPTWTILDGFSVEPPLVQVIHKGMRGIGDVLNDRPVAGAFKIGEAGLTLLGVKGTAQLFDILERQKKAFTMGGAARITRQGRKQRQGR